jgi:hypothetical protein
MESSLNREALDAIIERWSELTEQEAEAQPKAPLRTLLGEAVDLAELVDQYFKTVSVLGKTRLGLESLGGRGGITPQTSTEIRELQTAIGHVQSRYLVSVEQVSTASVERSEELLKEFRAALAFLLEDGEHATGEEQLARLRDEYDDVTSHDGTALALESYAELASQYREELESLGGFDTSNIIEARAMAVALRQRSAERLTGDTAQRQRELLGLRNRVVSALTTRMLNARRAIRFVFRDYPAIVRQAGSEYARRRKREWREDQRDEKDQKEAEVTPQTPS